MTEKLYYTDSYLSEFEARIVSVENIGKSTAVVLDKTAFFPEGGGQPADTGYIEHCFVCDVQEKDGEIYHIISNDNVPQIGAVVSCRTDAEKRFARMQSHSGEHIISGIAHSLFGAENVGFHMDDTLMTVDFNLPLTKEQLKIIEEKANECIYKNLSIKTYTVSAEEAARYNYRSKLEFTGDVRLVEIEDTDLCACCAPHVNSTGEIGIIKILTSASHRGGVRITLICGKTAFDDYIMKHNATMEISALLCAKHNETAAAVKKLIEANTSQKYDFSLQQKNLLSIIADKINPSETIVEFYNNLSMNDLRELVNFTKCKCGKVCIALSGDYEKGYSYCIFSELPELNTIVRDFNNVCKGSGGGKGSMLQGRVKGSKEEINQYFKELKV